MLPGRGIWMCFDCSAVEGVFIGVAIVIRGVSGIANGRGLCAGKVKKEIDIISDSFNPGAFYLFDDNFLVDKKVQQR
jgi:hypothetical protein